VTLGRRLADNADIREAEPGDYFFVDWTGRRELWFRDPNGDAGRVTSHTVTEHEDGTVSVSPSIAPNEATTYHGYLTRGVWEP
jgi:hypothetical protein